MGTRTEGLVEYYLKAKPQTRSDSKESNENIGAKVPVFIRNHSSATATSHERCEPADISPDQEVLWYFFSTEIALQS